MKRPRQTRRALLIVLSSLLVGALVAWPFLTPGREAYDTVPVTRGNIESSVTALGTLQPRQFVDVGAQASGQIRKIHVEAGVTQGADQDIGTDTTVLRHVAARVVEADIGGIIGHRDADLAARRGNDLRTGLRLKC